MILDIFIIAIPTINALNVFFLKEVLRAPFTDLIEASQSILVFILFEGSKDQDAGGQLCAVKYVGPKPNNSLNNIHLEKLFANFSFLALTE